MTEESPGVVVVSTPKELLNITELQDVVFYEVSGKRTDEEDDDPKPLQLRVLVRTDEKELRVRFQSNLAAHGGAYAVDTEAIFALAKPSRITSGALQEFIERVAMMVVYPYIRAAIDDTAARLSLDRPGLGLLRSNEIQSYREDEKPEETSSAD
jgi:hypothetical protein